MDLTKVLLSGIKFFLASLAGVVVAALTVAVTGYKPSNPLEIVLAQYMAIPLIAAVIGAINNFIKHLNDK